MLKALLEIDPRGGYYAQEVMQKAMSHGLGDDGTRKLVENTEDKSMEVGDILHSVTYLIRVMLSHVRLLHDQFFANHPKNRDPKHSLKELFDVMHNAKGGRTAARQSRVQGNRPHPFFSFRKAGDDDEHQNEEPEDVEVICVTKFGRPTLQVAQMLLSDGVVCNADAYEAGAEGFVVAKWAQPSTIWTTEIPNDFLEINATGNRVDMVGGGGGER